MALKTKLFNDLITFTRASSATRTNAQGLIESVSTDQPRFDYDPVTLEPKGLLIEEQRTNLLTYSDQFDNAVWGKYRVTVLSNQVIAPDGTLTADRVIETTENNSHVIRNDGFVYTNGTTYTATGYFKSNGRNLAIRMSGIAASEVFFNLTSGTIYLNNGANLGASITAVGNGWYRCSVTYAYTSQGPIAFDLINGTSGSNIYTGDGYSGIYIWGAQLEAGSFPTSYIPTTTAQVTRSADSASMTGTNFSSWFRNDQGSLYSEFSIAADGSSSQAMIPLSMDSGTADGIYFYKGSSSTSIRVYSGSANALLGNMTLNATQKSILGYDTGGINGSLNGAAVVSATGKFSQTPIQLLIGKYYGGLQTTFTIKKLAYYPKKLSSTELQSLTS